MLSNWKHVLIESLPTRIKLLLGSHQRRKRAFLVYHQGRDAAARYGLLTNDFRMVGYCPIRVSLVSFQRMNMKPGFRDFARSTAVLASITESASHYAMHLDKAFV